MVLPHGVSKGLGLRAALAAFHLSVHNAIGIGNAENDHDLLATAGLGVAVAWGSRALKEQASEILAGDGPSAVAAYIRQKSEELRLSRLASQARLKKAGVETQIDRDHAFVFTDNGRQIGSPIRTAKDFVEPLNTLPDSIIEEHARRGDFSSWFAGVLHDQLLAADVREIEQRYRLGQAENLSGDLIQAIQARYEFSPQLFLKDTAEHR
jgi:haloacid dehalogenase-like hydrolase